MLTSLHPEQTCEQSNFIKYIFLFLERLMIVDRYSY